MFDKLLGNLLNEQQLSFGRRSRETKKFEDISVGGEFMYKPPGKDELLCLCVKYSRGGYRKGYSSDKNTYTIDPTTEVEVLSESMKEQIHFVDKILETYERVETDESYTTVSGSVNTPVATLADEYGGRAQIGTDDGCYILYLLQEDGSYKRTAWLFSEAHGVLKGLPDPEEAR